MKYTVQAVNPGVFEDMMPDGAIMYVKPEMPVLKFERDNVKYTVTDFRLMHPLGIQAIEICLKTMMTDPCATECRIECSKDLDEDTIDIVKHIVMGFEYKAKKGGKNGFTMESCVVDGVTTEMTDGENPILVFHFGGNFSKYAYEYFQENGGENVSMINLVVYVANKTREELLEVL